MLFVYLFALTNCLLERLSSQKNYTAVTYLLGEPNTVHFVQTLVKDISNKSFKPLGDDYVYTRMTIYKGTVDSKNVYFSDEKSREQNTFFFTTSTRDEYYIVFELVQTDQLEGMQVGLDYKIFFGDVNKPAIVSNNDVEVNRAENAIDRVLEFVKKNFIIQETEEEQESHYRGLYEDIIKKAVLLILIKIGSTGVTLYYTNKKTKTFYEQQGLGVAAK